MIVDASVALKWLVIEADSPVAAALLERSDLIAPALLHVEVANAIWKKRRRGELGDDPALDGLPGQLSTMIETVDDRPLIGRALELGMAIDHPVYDCVYLALAEMLDRKLVTADARLIAKATGAGMGDRVVRLDGVAR